MKVGITGSRDKLTNEAMIKGVEIITALQPIEIHHGDGNYGKTIIP